MPGLLPRHRKGGLDPEFGAYSAAHIGGTRKNEKSYIAKRRFEESDFDYSNAESNACTCEATHCSVENDKEAQDASNGAEAVLPDTLDPQDTTLINKTEETAGGDE